MQSKSNPLFQYLTSKCIFVAMKDRESHLVLLQKGSEEGKE